MSNNKNLEILFRKLPKIWPKGEFRTLILLIAFVSIVFAIVFTIIVGLGYFLSPLPKILLLALFIFFSSIVVSTLVVVRFKKSTERLETQNKIMENLFELAISARVLKILIPIFSALIIFFGWSSWPDLKKDIIEESKKEIYEEIDPEGYRETMKYLIDSTRIYIDSINVVITEVEKYILDLLPVGTIVAYDGRQELPDSWAPCDGNKVPNTNFITPDLVNRFIIGTSDFSQRKVGSTGGDSIHSHQVQISKEVVSEINIRNERHVGPFMRTVDDDYQKYPANHKHRINISLDISSNLRKHLPPYYALIFIIKYK